MAWSLQTITDAVASALTTTTGYRATGFPLDNPQPPCHLVQVGPIVPSTMTAAHTEIELRILTIVARASDRVGHQALYQMLSYGASTFGAIGAPSMHPVLQAEFAIDAQLNAPGSVRDALWPTTAGDYLDVAGLGFVSLVSAAPGAVSIGDAEMLAVEHTLVLIARRS
jgi:hypothetical protein